MALELSCTSEEKILVTLTPTTAHGNPAAIEGSPTVEVASGDGTSEPEGTNPLQFWILSGSNPGDTVFVVKGDADLGSGVIEIADTITLHVSNPFASSLGMSAAAPVQK